jgi:hypothetical protein
MLKVPFSIPIPFPSFSPVRRRHTCQNVIVCDTKQQQNKGVYREGKKPKE